MTQTENDAFEEMDINNVSRVLPWAIRRISPKRCSCASFALFLFPSAPKEICNLSFCTEPLMFFVHFSSIPLGGSPSPEDDDVIWAGDPVEVFHGFEPIAPVFGADDRQRIAWNVHEIAEQFSRAQPPHRWEDFFCLQLGT